MQQLLSQLPLAQRIPTLAAAIRSLRAATEQNAREEAELLDLLRQAEQELVGAPAGSEGAEPSGLLEPKPPPPPTAKQKAAAAGVQPVHGVEGVK
jgi:hypothetical protein